MKTETIFKFHTHNLCIELEYKNGELAYNTIIKYLKYYKYIYVATEIELSNNEYVVDIVDFRNGKTHTYYIKKDIDLLLERISKYVGRKITKTIKIVFSS